MELLQLRYFLAVARFEHVTKAAEFLHVSQPTLSQAIIKLEKELGFPLFIRVGKTIRLNESGVRFFEAVEKALAMLEESVSELRDINTSCEQTITLSAWPGSKTMATLMTLFSQKYPNLKMDLLMDERDEAESDVQYFWLAYGDMLKQPSELLIQEKLLLAIPNSNPLSHRKELPLAAVRNERFICPPVGKPLNEIPLLFCQRAGFTPNRALEYDAMETLSHMLQLNQGIAFVPEKTWGNIYRPERYQLVQIEYPHCVRSLYMSWRQNTEHASAIELLYQFSRKHFERINNAPFML